MNSVKILIAIAFFWFVLTLIVEMDGERKSFKYEKVGSTKKARSLGKRIAKNMKD